MSSAIITSLIWVKKGFASAIPIEYEEEEEKIKECLEVNKKLQKKGKLTGKETIKEQTKKLENQLDNLDIKEGEQDNVDNVPVFCDEFNAYYKATGDEDEEVAEGEPAYPEGFDDISEDEEDDFTIHSTDALIACATAQDDISNIEVYVYDEINQALYVHHDYLLSSYPLCVEWLAKDPRNKGNTKANYAIVGSFLPEIEIWNLDELNAVDPAVTLGKIDDDDKYYKNMKKKKNKLKTINTDLLHTEAVMTLNVNPFNSHVLVSGGADSKILFWDLSTLQATRSITEHKDKVQTARWNKMEDSVLLTGSYDKTLKLFDVRSESACTTINTGAEIESIDWSCVNKYLFLSSYENGKIDLYDIRKFDTLVSFQGHKKAVTNVSFSNKKEGLFASCSLDSHVKIWDAENTNINPLDNTVSPALICDKFLKKSTGELFTVKFSEDLDYTIAVGGSTGELFIWQLEENPIFCSRYGLTWEEEKSDEFSKISKKRMQNNRLRLKGEKKRKNNK